MSIEHKISHHIADALQSLFGIEVNTADIQLQPTRKEFEGTITFVTFPFSKPTKKKPDELAEAIGVFLQKQTSWVVAFNVVKGFLNLTISDEVWVSILKEIASDANFGKLPANGTKVMVEYSSPNTNKPLHLGHLRNNFLGAAVAEILTAAGYEVRKVNLVNDRGIHICKSMIAYQYFGNGEQPSATLKGDHLVGKYYVCYDSVYKKQVAELIEKYKAENSGLSEEDIKEKAEKNAPILLEAQEMLTKWEAKDPETIALWQKMNTWVLAGFEDTYKTIGVSFDKTYYESNTYLLGKDVVEEGLQKGVMYRKPDTSVWIDLTPDGLDEKLLLRSNGTSVYMTQDLGTADMKYKDFQMQKSVYVVGNEQDYHFKVLQLILKKLERPYADGIYHLSYGMVELPEGKMKSREGTVVDADDLVAEMIATAKERTAQLGKIDGFSTEEAEKLHKVLALGALKYYLLRVDPKKKMLFDPKESIDFQGNTGVYIQYNYAKISAILRKAAKTVPLNDLTGFDSIKKLEEVELDLIAHIAKFPTRLKEAALNYDPSSIANYAYDLSRLYSRMYAELPILSEVDTVKMRFRVILSAQTAATLKKACGLLGIEVPERM
jgi:arginyl-tRNA synthetase